jgi:putative tryptophan/tyrosine transport system substrate-binding protein
MKCTLILAPALLLLLAAPTETIAQASRKTATVGYVRSGTPDIDPYRSHFLQGMKDLGYVDGRNVSYEFRHYGDSIATAQSIMNELVGLKVDVIVAGGGAAIRAAQSATRTIPIVMGAVSEPLGSGLIEGLARPGGNTTGLSLLASELNAKRLQLLKEVIPSVSRVALLQNPDNPSHAAILSAMEPAGRALGLTLRAFDARGGRNLEDTFAAMKAWPADGVIVLEDTTFVSNRATLAEQAREKRLPLVCSIRELGQAGACLFSYATNIADMYYRAAGYVDKILKGANPGDLPVQQPVKFEFVINLKIANLLGLEISPTLLARADEVVE